MYSSSFVKKNDRIDIQGFTEHSNNKSRTGCNVNRSLTMYFRHEHHQKIYIGMDDRGHRLYFDREMFCLYLVAQQIEVLGPLSMMSEVWKGERADGEGFCKGVVISLEGEVCRAGLSVSIGATVSAC